MTTVSTGHQAETAAKVYLEMRGFHIIEQNWRKPRYEIDIIAQKHGVIYFVEVKYRFGNQQGGGFEAITSSKLQHMRNAAWAWVDEQKWHGEYVLSAIELAGPDFSILSFIENAY
ncbi:MAG TPA: YraN family protein [Candidatus Saccharimonadales bacterium]|nr:YraN family protein [Candidatus Saccharimonadales bacterium]